jgi:putative ABC transport system permease protein
MSVLRTQLRGVGRRPAKLLLTGLGILVAAFFAYATVLAQQVAERAVADGLSETPNGSSVVIDSPSDPIPPATVDAVRKVPGVAEVSARATGGVQYGSDQNSQFFYVVTDPGSGTLSRVKVTAGSYPDAAGEVAITTLTAERDGLRVGQRVNLMPEPRFTPDGTELPQAPAVSALITGVVKAPEDQGASFYTVDRAATALLDAGYERIDVRAAPGTSIPDLTSALASTVPEGPQVRDAVTVRAEEIAKKVEEIKPIFALLAMFVAIAVIAAALVVTSTFRIMFAQRMSQLALLRAVGAGRGRLTGALIVEGALTGLVAGVAGVGVATVLGQLATPVAGHFGLDLPAPGAPIGWAVAIVLGAVLVTVVAVLAPAFSAARVSPLQALRTSATTTSRTGIGVVRALFGAVLVLLAAGTAALAAFPDGPLEEDTMLLLSVIVVSGTAAYGALLAFGPVLIGPLLKIVSVLIGRLGPVGRLAVGGVGGAPRRAAAVSAVVALGVTLIAGVLVGSSTLRSLADTELALEYPADIETRATEVGKGLPKDLVQRLDARPELAEVLPYRKTAATIGEQELQLVDLDVRALPTASRFQTKDGSLNDLGPGRVAIPEAWADVLQVKAGEKLTLTVGSQQQTLTIGAVLKGAGPLNATTILHPSDFARLDPAAPVEGVLVNATGAEKKALTEARAAVIAEVGGVPGVTVDMLADKRNEVTGWLTVMTGIALGLLGLTVLIAVVGVGTTTALSVVQRRRESGMLRAIGLTRGGLKTSITVEAGIYGMVGSILGLALGIPYAALMLGAVDLDAPVVIPGGQLLAVFAALAGLTALAGLLPARRAAKVSPVAALAAE